jgi:surface polysaccharide O-acyltransferase-like enzyme
VHQSLLQVNTANDNEETAHVNPGRMGNLSFLKPAASRRRSRYLNVLQIAGALSIVARHVDMPFSNPAWIAVDMFFVLAGMNMARALDGEQSICSYAVSRVERFGPQMLVIWCVAVVSVLAGAGSPGMMSFIAVGPVFLHNLAQPFFIEYTFPRDWIFGPLWFVAALIQLQILLFALRRVLVRARPDILLLVAVGVAISFRTLYTMLVAQNPASLHWREADFLYVLPLTHLEAVILGVLIGRGALLQVSRLLPLFFVLAISLVAINMALSPGEVSEAIKPALGLNFSYPLGLHYAHIWGYSVIAFAAASLASPTGSLAVATGKLRLPGWTDNVLDVLAPLTYGVYGFHGLLLATNLNAHTLLARPHAPGLRLLLFAVTAVEAFLLAWMFQWMVDRLKQQSLRFPPAVWPTVANVSGRRRHGGGARTVQALKVTWSR